MAANFAINWNWAPGGITLPDGRYLPPIAGGADTAPVVEPKPDPEPEGGDELTRMLAEIKRMNDLEEQRQSDIERLIDDRLSKLTGGEPRTDKLTEPAVKGEWAEEFEQRGYTPADFELARMIMDGAGKLSSNPQIIEPSERFLNAYRANVDVKRIQIGRDGKPYRAMDTAETGYGLELIGAQYVRDLWTAARNSDTLVNRIRSIPMTDPTTYVPIDGALPEMLFVGESTGSSATAYTTSKTASNRVTLTAKKFTIQQIWSGELDEDSIIAFTPFLREKLNMSAALHLGSAYYNGDTTNAGTGNINSDDADPADTKHYLAWDGIRHYVLVDATGQGKNMAAALDFKEINVARGKLNGTDDDIDAAVGNINWGTNAADLLLVADWDTYMAMLDGDKVTTVDKYGPGATIVTGELGRIYGIPIIAPSYATKTEADGKASGTESNNTKGQIMLFNPMGFLGGVRRDVQLFFDRIQRTDQFLFELYTRRAFTRFGGNVAAGIYNISL